MQECMFKHYETLEQIRTEQNTWYPAVNYLINRIIDAEIQRRFSVNGAKVHWVYDNYPVDGGGDFGSNEPDGSYEYETCKDVIKIILLHHATKKVVYLAGDWLWKNALNRPSEEFGYNITSEDKKRLDALKKFMETSTEEFLEATKHVKLPK